MALRCIKGLGRGGESLSIQLQQQLVTQCQAQSAHRKSQGIENILEH